MTKPDCGRIKNAVRVPVDNGKGLGYSISGEFLDHPMLRGQCRTSEVMVHDEATGTIETRNTIYHLVTEGKPTRQNGWPFKGDKMRFLGKNGYDSELAKAKQHFAVGTEYEVERCDVGDWSHTVEFVGIAGKWNGVMFELVQ